MLDIIRVCDCLMYMYMYVDIHFYTLINFFTCLLIYLFGPLSLPRMKALLKPAPDKQYVDLTLCFENETGEDVPGPPVRYYF